MWSRRPVEGRFDHSFRPYIYAIRRLKFLYGYTNTDTEKIIYTSDNTVRIYTTYIYLYQPKVYVCLCCVCMTGCLPSIVHAFATPARGQAFQTVPSICNHKQFMPAAAFAVAGVLKCYAMCRGLLLFSLTVTCKFCASGPKCPPPPNPPS